MKGLLIEVSTGLMEHRRDDVTYSFVTVKAITTPGRRGQGKGTVAPEPSEG